MKIDGIPESLLCKGLQHLIHLAYPIVRLQYCQFALGLPNPGSDPSFSTHRSYMRQAEQALPCLAALSSARSTFHRRVVQSGASMTQFGRMRAPILPQRLPGSCLQVLGANGFPCLSTSSYHAFQVRACCGEATRQRMTGANTDVYIPNSITDGVCRSTNKPNAAAKLKQQAKKCLPTLRLQSLRISRR